MHLCIVFNVLFIYIGMPPRTNLVLDDAYNDHVYGAPRASIGGESTSAGADARERRRASAKRHSGGRGG